MGFKNIKRSAYFKPNGMRVNCDGTTIQNRKINIQLCSNHFKFTKRVHRIWNPGINGQAIRDGNGWYK